MEYKGLKIAVVVARFNREITEKLEEGALRILTEKGLESQQIQLVHVPGAFEIPLAAKAFLLKDFDAVIALGCVIRGDTSHYDYVCEAAERGCSQVQLEFQKPVVFGILTTENDAQAFERVGGSHGHKGEEAAEVALEMILLLRKIKSL